MQVEELIKAKKEKDKRLRQQAAKEWREIDEATLKFDRRDQEISALQACTKHSLTTMIQVVTFSSIRFLSLDLGSQKHCTWVL